MKHYIKYLIVWVVLFSTNYQLINNHFRTIGFHKIMQSDALGYYEYLPYFFIKHDVAHQEYAYKLENGNTFNKYTVGVAILQSPFFALTHLYNSITQNDANIFAPIYGKGIAIAASFYLACALLLLYSVWKKMFNSITAAISVCLVYLGTNLYYYSIYEPGMSHVYSFFCFSAFLFIIPRFFERASIANTFFLALFLSLAILIRPTSIVLGLLIPLYNVYSVNELNARLRFIFKNKMIVPLIVLVSAIVFIPQLLYWHKTTGNFVVFSYGINHEGFTHWKAPKIIPTLIGTHCGWLPFTPVMLFSLIGMPLLIIKKKFSGVAIVSIFICILYLCSSWWAYNFSCAFGYRSFVEYYTLLMIPISYLIFMFFKKNAVSYNTVTIVMVFFFILFNIKLIQEYRTWIWCTDDFTWDKYFQVLDHVFHG